MTRRKTPHQHISEATAAAEEALQHALRANEAARMMINKAQLDPEWTWSAGTAAEWAAKAAALAGNARERATNAKHVHRDNPDSKWIGKHANAAKLARTAAAKRADDAARLTTQRYEVIYTNPRYTD